MHIKGIDDPLGVNRSHGATPPAKAPKTTPRAEPQPDEQTQDHVDTSTLSRMMAESKVDLHLELTVRPERLNSMRKIVELPADFPDPVVDEVMRRLL